MGTICGLYVTHAAGAPMVAAELVEAVAKRGLVGDRYYLETGYYSKSAGWGANVTLIESEAIAAINAGHQTNFTAAMLRRNIVTAQIKLETLIGRRFQCGTAVLRGTKVFPPCAHLAKLLGEPKILRYLAYCGGLGAEVICDGVIRVNDRVEVMQDFWSVEWEAAARELIDRAGVEAIAVGEEFLSTQHLLLAACACWPLDAMRDVTIEQVRAAVIAMKVPRGEDAVSISPWGQTPRFKLVVQFAMQRAWGESRAVSCLDVWHGLLADRDSECLAVLRFLGMDPDRLREFLPR